MCFFTHAHAHKSVWQLFSGASATSQPPPLFLPAARRAGRQRERVRQVFIYQETKKKQRKKSQIIVFFFSFITFILPSQSLFPVTLSFIFNNSKYKSCLLIINQTHMVKISGQSEYRMEDCGCEKKKKLYKALSCFHLFAADRDDDGLWENGRKQTWTNVQRVISTRQHE